MVITFFSIISACCYILHFHSFLAAIFDVITEGQQFEYMGFVVNPIIRLAIMRKDLLFSDVEAVSDMIDKYNGIVMGLSVAEVCV